MHGTVQGFKVYKGRQDQTGQEKQYFMTCALSEILDQPAQFC